MLNLFRRFRNNESGATVVEYALIAGLICVSVIIGASQIGNIFQDHADTIEQANDR